MFEQTANRIRTRVEHMFTFSPALGAGLAGLDTLQPELGLLLALIFEPRVSAVAVFAYREFCEDSFGNLASGQAFKKLLIVWQVAARPLLADESDKCAGFILAQYSAGVEEVGGVELECGGLH